jgi:histidinol-phosphate phosphatase family protein
MRDFAGYTLFLDRDGVLNERIIGNYVTKPDEFVIINGVLEALKKFSVVFGRIVIVTNQQGIGKGLMTEDDLEEVHNVFLKKVSENGGRIDKVYFSPWLEREHSFYREPNIGMALKAKKDFPEIRFRHSLMVGDSLSDMKFGKNAGMTTVLVGDNPEMARQYPYLVDYYYPTLFDFSKEIDIK